MNKKKDAPAKLYFFSGTLFILAGVISKTVMYIPVGCCFIILGAMKQKNK